MTPGSLMDPRYETRKHLWLVLEYCVGGNLRALLEADGKLPEESIRIFSRDLALALQHMHEKVTQLPHGNLHAAGQSVHLCLPRLDNSWILVWHEEPITCLTKATQSQTRMKGHRAKAKPAL